LREYKHHRHDAQGFFFTHAVALLLLIMPGAMLLSAPREASGEVYTWENADGTLGVADDVSKVPEKYRGRAKKVGEGTQGEGETGGVYYGKPQEKMPEETAPAPRRRAARSAPAMKEEPLITMGEKKKAEDKAAEQRKKDEEEIKRVWENMKKALAGH
jgi:hypothetical protein